MEHLVYTAFLHTPRSASWTIRTACPLWARLGRRDFAAPPDACFPARKML